MIQRLTRRQPRAVILLKVENKWFLCAGKLLVCAFNYEFNVDNLLDLTKFSQTQASILRMLYLFAFCKSRRNARYSGVYSSFVALKSA
jgi:hypothetical protein